jgi:signal transduction histidine kinase
MKNVMSADLRKPQSLRFHLLFSYILLLMLTLLTIVGAILFTTSIRTAPPQPIWQQLTMLVRGLNRTNLINEFVRTSPGVEEATIADLMGTYAQSVGVRVIRFQMDMYGGTTVIYDSDEQIALYHVLPDQYFDVRYGAPDSQSRLNLGQMFRQIYGTFNADNTEWLFSGFVDDRISLVGDVSGVLVALPRPSQTLQGLLADFGSDLFLPLLQASVIGLVIAFVLAYFISRTIAQPLQSLSHAAEAIAHGDLNHQAEVGGPYEIRALAEAFNYMTAEVRRTQTAQQDFLANISHDLKTPLTSIQGYSQAIIDQTVSNPEKAANIIYEESVRLTRMVTAITDLARMQAGQMVLNLTEIDLAGLVKAVSDRLEVMANKQHIQFDVSTSRVQPIMGDGDRLVQVLDNLIGNAIKYTPSGGRVSLKVIDVQDGVMIHIRDTGVGIPQADLSRIFERFYQVDKARGPQRGTGLGLAIAHEIIVQHHGTIHVTSQEGQGTEFRVWLPYATTQPRDNSKETTKVRR